MVITFRFITLALRYIGFIAAMFLLHNCANENATPREDVRERLLEEINLLRKSGCTCGSELMPPVKALMWNSALEHAAASHAYDMATHDYFSHISLSGKSPIDRASNAGYAGLYVGEVIARKYNLTEDVVKAWEQSESHCRALMDSTYNDMGGARKGDYWVVDLGKLP